MAEVNKQITHTANLDPDIHIKKTLACMCALARTLVVDYYTFARNEKAQTYLRISNALM